MPATGRLHACSVTTIARQSEVWPRGGIRQNPASLPSASRTLRFRPLPVNPDFVENPAPESTRARSMPSSQLDNPFWWSLRTRHQAIALGNDAWARYPAEFAPFLGVANAAVDLRGALAPGEQAFLLGVLPAIPEGWQLQTFRPLAQMVCPTPMALVDGTAHVIVLQPVSGQLPARPEPEPEPAAPRKGARK